MKEEICKDCQGTGKIELSHNYSSYCQNCKGTSKVEYLTKVCTWCSNTFICSLNEFRYQKGLCNNCHQRSK